MDVFLEYARRGRNAWWRYALCAVLTLAFALGLGALITTALMLGDLLPADFETRIQDPAQPVSFFLANGVIFAVLTAGLVSAARLVHGKRFADLLGRWSWRAYLRGAGVWFLVLIGAALIDFAIAPQGFSISANSDTLLLVAVAVPALLVQTFAEEVLFRGYITQGLLLATRRILPAAVISGAIFGAVHIPNGLPQAVSATAFGVVLAIIAIRTGSIAFASGLHFANNIFAATVLVSAGDAFRNTPGLFTQATPHLMWWDTAVGVLALVAVAWFVTRRAPSA
jgi:membrane protease YdiL (CAAX protease family)